MSIKENVTRILKKENKAIVLQSEEDYQAAFRDVGVDSLDLMMTILKIGEEYQIQISEDDIEQLESVNDLIRYIDACTSPAAARQAI